MTFALNSRRSVNLIVILACASDDVMVGEYVAVFGNDEARAHSPTSDTSLVILAATKVGSASGNLG